MKAVVSAVTAVRSEAAVAGGKVSRSRDLENEEIQMYLAKLKDLVPFMPKNRKLSKLEVIQHVIDYICDLQCALETHPTTVEAFDAASVLGQKKSQAAASPRQPLGVRRSPNRIVSPCEAATVLHNVTTVDALTPCDRPSSC
ncbi:protein extra-macrochaetae [Cylas formicarius]|uniref:protein extra-macrochaetae n=1 Tax=Cylas formicarius TaxID=197179 RepID=UPI00295837D9|nr:protein extra-macrochaetae [Cylas formicarius]